VERCDVVLGGRRIGQASWQSGGLRYRVAVRCRYEPGCFYRAILEADGNPISLGLLVLEEGEFVTERSLTAPQSRQLKTAQTVQCRIERSCMDDCGEPDDPEQQMPEPSGDLSEEFEPVLPEKILDPLLQRLIRERGDVVKRGDLLAMPAREGEDPMAPFFCLLQPEIIGDAPWYLLQVEQGIPVPPQIGQKSSLQPGTMDRVMT